MKDLNYGSATLQELEQLVPAEIEVNVGKEKELQGICTPKFFQSRLIWFLLGIFVSVVLFFIALRPPPASSPALPFSSLPILGSRNPEECTWAASTGHVVGGIYDCPIGYFFRGCGWCYKCVPMHCDAAPNGCLPSSSYFPTCSEDDAEDEIYSFTSCVTVDDTPRPENYPVKSKCLMAENYAIKCCKY